MNDERKTKKAWSMGLCIALGAGAGTAMSVSMDNWAYLAIGIGVAVAIGGSLGNKPKRDEGENGAERAPQ